MNSTIVYTNTSFSSANNTISIGHHTDALYIHNLDHTVPAIVELNGKHRVLIPDSPNAGAHMYHCIPGDYTTIKVLTVGPILCMYAVG